MRGRAEAVKTQDSPLAFCVLLSVFSWLLSLSWRSTQTHVPRGIYKPTARARKPYCTTAVQPSQLRKQHPNYLWLRWWHSTRVLCSSSVRTASTCSCSKSTKPQAGKECSPIATPKTAAGLQYTVKTITTYPAEHSVYRHTNQAQNQPITKH